MPWSFSDLILLMGTNPLPNYVVAKYFILENKFLQRIWIIHSEEKANINQAETKKLAENLKLIIEMEQNDYSRRVRIKLIPLSDISSARQIMKDIEEKLTDGIKGEANFSSCHLNYTGGTKAMAVHVYRKLEQELSHNCTFSYLSGRDFKLKDDLEGAVTRDLRDKINIGLDTLMKLHGYKKSNEQDNPNWPCVLDKFTEIIAQGKLKEYLQWVNKFVSAKYYNEKGFIKKTSSFLAHNQLLDQDGNINKLKLIELQNNFRKETPEFIIELLKEIPEEHSLLIGGELWTPAPKLPNKDFIYRLGAAVKDFLHGKWLEAYVQEIVTDNIERINQEEKRCISVTGNWEIKKIGQTKPFELDVIMLNGYQVVGISVTTSGNESVCKEKGFEVLHRVNQVGGDEGKAILVTCLEKPKRDTLAGELRLISGSTGDKLEVLGTEELPPDKLWKKVSRHIWGEVK